MLLDKAARCLAAMARHSNGMVNELMNHVQKRVFFLGAGAGGGGVGAGYGKLLWLVGWLVECSVGWLVGSCSILISSGRITPGIFRENYSHSFCEGENRGPQIRNNKNKKKTAQPRFSPVFGPFWVRLEIRVRVRVGIGGWVGSTLVP